MLKKIVSKVKESIKKMRETMAVTAGALLVAYETMPVTAYASNSYLAPLTNLKTVIISIVAAAGVIVLLYGVVKFATSFQKMDQNGEHQAVYTIIAGGVMIGVSAVLTALGA